jgi:hypothetical protein
LHSNLGSAIALGQLSVHCLVNTIKDFGILRMRNDRIIVLAVMFVGMGIVALGQTTATTTLPVAAGSGIVSAAPTAAVKLLEGFSENDVKFDLAKLMETLRDRRHEGWVLAAYPDPKTGQPLIGAGFSLDLPAREHAQTDPLNPHLFLEPSSAELWQAAGLEPARLDAILGRFHERKDSWSGKKFRKAIKTLEPDITEEDSMLLLRVGAIQAIYNAQAYCRNFDQLTAPQQMAMSQLVYQMGVNLAEFSQFLSLVNSDAVASGVEFASLEQRAWPDAEYWAGVQKSLIESQWARLYRTRAIAVIAMLDPRYEGGPAAAEHRVGVILRPTVVHRHRNRASAGMRQVESTSHHRRAGQGATARRRAKRRV